MRSMDTLGHSHDGIAGEADAHLLTFVDSPSQTGYAEVTYSLYLRSLTLGKATVEYFSVLDGLAMLHEAEEDLGPRFHTRAVRESRPLEEKLKTFKTLGLVDAIEEAYSASRRPHVGRGL